MLVKEGYLTIRCERPCHQNTHMRIIRAATQSATPEQLSRASAVDPIEAENGNNSIILGVPNRSWLGTRVLTLPPACFQ